MFAAEQSIRTTHLELPRQSARYILEHGSKVAKCSSPWLELSVKLPLFRNGSQAGMWRVRLRCSVRGGSKLNG